jgi:hypothetical protein
MAGYENDISPLWRMCDMAVACKNDISPFMCLMDGNGGSGILICPFILAYGRHGCRVQERYKAIHFGG